MPTPDLTRELERAWLQSDPADLPRTPPRQATELDRRVDEWLRTFLGGTHDAR